MRNKELNYFITLLAKNIQFRYATWRQSREIAKAYGKQKRLHLPRIGLRFALITSIVIVVPALLSVSVPYGVKEYNVIANLLRDARQRSLNQKARADTTAADEQKAASAAIASPDTADASGAPAHITAATDSPKVDSAKIPVTSGLIDRALDYCIIANKADRTLYLLSNSDKKGTWKTIERFSILVGRNEGPKMTAGDNRTPEGTYFIIGRKESEELNAIYGPLAYMLNYPNEEDRKTGRTGQGIWIHGTREDTTREATRGCVVLNNDDVLTLARYLQLGIGTPVIIVNDPGLTVPQRVPNMVQLQTLHERILNGYDARHNEFEGILTQWKKAWESRDIDNYARFYDPDRFFGEGMHWEAWRDKKERTFKAYTTISITLDRMCVSEFSESTAVVLFVQRYESDAFRLQKPKKLSFVKTDGRWKIYKEETFSRQELLL